MPNFLSSNILSSPTYGVFISRWYNMSDLCSSYECARVILRAMRFSNKLLGQWYVRERLISSFAKFYGDVIKYDEVSLSRMLHYILEYDLMQWHPSLIRHYTFFWPCYSERFPKNICNGFRILTEFTNSSGSLVLTRLKLVNVLSLDQTLKNVIFPDFEFRTSLSISILLNKSY